ncbi:tRNA lysidine(34) synthetase TilS [Roseibium aquae]|nr:tRNA lysidine(34) synthetase TilS [Roseibium aquae]
MGLTSDEIDSIFRPQFPLCRLVLGVSGGPDSLALLYLFHEWTKRVGWTGDILVATIDHGLRPESAAEAQQVGERARAMGLRHVVRTWEGEKPSSNIQAQARAARYRLFAQEMASIGADALVLAHHLDDQAETFLDRLTRGSGVYGLGAMIGDDSGGPEGLRIMRPFLEVPKSALMDALRARGIPWVCDPSNYDPAYKRARLRQIMGGLAEEGLTSQRLADTARRMRRAREGLDYCCRSILNAHLVCHPAGPVRLPWNSIGDPPEEIRLRLLAHLILGVTGQQAPGRLAKLEGLLFTLEAHERVKQTLSGAVVQRQDDTLYLWKEVGRTPPAVCRVADLVAAAQANGRPAIWDGRYHLGLEGAGFLNSDVVIGPLVRAPGPRDGLTLPSDFPVAAFACAPAFWDSEGLLYVPDLFQMRGSEAAYPLSLKRTGLF